MAAVMKRQGSPRRPAGPSGSADTFHFIWCQSDHVHPDLIDDSRPDRRTVGSDGDVPDDHVRELFHGPFIHVRRMIGLLVPAGSHHDLQPRGTGDPRQTMRVPAETEIADIYYRASAPVLELRNFRDR